MAQLIFDATTVEVQDFEALPAGTYEVVITDSEMRNTKAQNGEMLVLTMDIISGDFKGRKVWDRLNLVNQNPQAVEIATRTLATICRAIGVMQISETSELHDKPLLVNLARRTTPDGSIVNEVRGYRPRGGSAPVAPKSAPQSPAPNTTRQLSASAGSTPVAPAPVATPAPETASVTPPWMR